MMTILTQRELFLIVLCTVTYVALFVVAVQNSRRKILLLEERLNKVRAIQEDLQAQSRQSIEVNKNKIADLERMLEKLDDEETYGIVLRAKGIVQAEDGSWIHFDYVPGETDVRLGSAIVTGRLCVIGSKLKEEAIEALFA